MSKAFHDIKLGISSKYTAVEKFAPIQGPSLDVQGRTLEVLILRHILGIGSENTTAETFES